LPLPPIFTGLFFFILFFPYFHHIANSYCGGYDLVVPLFYQNGMVSFSCLKKCHTVVLVFLGLQLNAVLVNHRKVVIHLSFCDRTYIWLSGVEC
jgi:hypothetical protein